MRAISRIIVTLIMLLSIGSISAQSSKITAQKQLIEKLKREVATGEKEVATLRKSKATKEKQLRSLASQIESRNRLLRAQSSQIKLLEEEITKSDRKYGELNRELNREKSKYEEMVREAYRNYRYNNLMSYLFTSEDFVDMARKIVNLRAISQLREERVTRIEKLSTEVVEYRRTLASNRAALDATIKDLEQQKSNLQRDQRSAKSSIANMSSKEKKLLQEKDLQQRKLDSAISELRKLSKGNTTGATFTAKTSNLNLPVVGGRVKRYLDNMAEILGAKGAKVISIYEGKVVDIKQNRITGKYDLYIAHGEYITSYAGLSSVSVAKSSRVTKNQAIGVIGESVDIITMQSEYKLVFGIYPPNPKQTMKASDCFKK